MKDNIISDEEFELQMKGFTIEDINNAINIQEQKDIAEFIEILSSLYNDCGIYESEKVKFIIGDYIKQWEARG